MNGRYPEKDRPEGSSVRPINEPVPPAPGWYPDATTGGTKYSDGQRWTGDTRPLRRPLAAAAHHKSWWILLVIGAILVAQSFTAFTKEDRADSVGGMIGEFVFSLLIGFVLVAVSLYLQRGQGPTTKSIEKRIAAAKQEANAQFGAAGRTTPPPPAPVAAPAAAAAAAAAAASQDASRAAQINALADPETARALQNLQNLLYTQALTDAEYQAAKDRLLSPTGSNDPLEQVEKLSQLYQKGILNEAEFAQAKAKALGL